LTHVLARQGKDGAARDNAARGIENAGDKVRDAVNGKK